MTQRRIKNNQRGAAEQWIKEGIHAVIWPRLFCHNFVDDQVRLQLFVLAYNPGTFLWQAVLRRALRHWTLTWHRKNGAWNLKDDENHLYPYGAVSKS